MAGWESKTKGEAGIHLFPLSLVYLFWLLTPAPDYRQLSVAESVSAISLPALSTVAGLRRCYRNQRRADSHQVASLPQSVESQPRLTTPAREGTRPIAPLC